MKEYLFVYGTLLPARAPQDLQESIAGLEPVSAATMSGRIYDLGDFPGAVFDCNTNARVHGLVYQLPRGEVLQMLDDYEEYHPSSPQESLFIREKRPVTLPDGSVLQCWVYLYNRDPGKARLVPGGDYSAWLTRQASNP